MAGFSPKGVEEALNNLYKDYCQLLNSVEDTYQENSIGKMCACWQSELAVKQISKITIALNQALDVVTENLNSLFEKVNMAATTLASNEEANYTEVIFMGLDFRFRDTSREKNPDGNIDCLIDEVRLAFDNVERFIDNRLRKNMDDFEQRAYELAAAFDYNDMGERFKAELTKVANNVESYANQVKAKVKEFHTDFEKWAIENEKKLEENVDSLFGFEADTSGLTLNWE